MQLLGIKAIQVYSSYSFITKRVC